MHILLRVPLKLYNTNR